MTTLGTVPQETPPAPGGMHRELRLVDAAAFSVGLIGPVGAIALLGTGAAGIIGRGVTLSFIFAVIGVALVGYAFIRLSQHIAHTGSVHALVGVTLGPRVRFLRGLGAVWCLRRDRLWLDHRDRPVRRPVPRRHRHRPRQRVRLDRAARPRRRLRPRLQRDPRDHPHPAGVRDLRRDPRDGPERRHARQVDLRSRPQGQTFNWHFLQLPHGADLGTVASAAVYGFLAFAGFEGAAALGEETDSPKTQIPRAVRVAIVVVGAFYLLTAAAQSLGYGTSAAGVNAYMNGFPFGDLGKGYIGSAYADVLILMATVSLIAISLSTASGAARIAYALSRDAAGPGRGLAVLSRHGQPARALFAVLGLIAAGLVAQRIAGSAVLDATSYALTLGTISLLVAYVLATAGAIRFLFFAGAPKAPRWQAAIPTLGGMFVIYTIYKNVVHVPSPYSYFGWIVLVWLLIGAALVAMVPGLATRVRAGLAAALAP